MGRAGGTGREATSAHARRQDPRLRPSGATQPSADTPLSFRSLPASKVLAPVIQLKVTAHYWGESCQVAVSRGDWRGVAELRLRTLNNVDTFLFVCIGSLDLDLNLRTTAVAHIT